MEPIEQIYRSLLTLLIFCSVFLNGGSLLVFYFMRRRLCFSDQVMVSLMVSDLSRSLLGHMINNIAFYESAKIYSSVLCIAAGYFTTFFAFTAIAHFTVLIIDVYLIICKPFAADKLHLRRRNFFYTCLITWFYGLFWASLPFIGLSEYYTSFTFGCSINWKLQTTANKIYVSLMFLSSYLSPIMIMAVFYYLTMKGLHRRVMKARKSNGKNSGMEKDAIGSHIKVRNIVRIMMLSFFIAWTPYAFVSGYHFFVPSAKGPRKDLKVLIFLFAKSSTLFNPIIYIIKYKLFRDKCKENIKKWSLYCFSCIGIGRSHSLEHDIPSTRASTLELAALNDAQREITQEIDEIQGNQVG